MTDASQVRFQISARRPETRSFDITLTLDGFDRRRLRLLMPVWTPGSYMVREFEKNVWALAASGPDGRPLAAVKRDKRTWEIRAAGAGPVTVRYRVFAAELSVRTAYLSRERGFFNGANLLFQPEGWDGPVALAIEAPAGWTVATALPETGPGRYRAENYDHLYDCPVALAPHACHDFEAAGALHRLAVCGGQLAEPERLVDELRRVVAEEARLFGGLPVRRYTILLALTGDEAGGLEHADSMAVLWPGCAQHTAAHRRSFLRLIAHEYFHLWNVKRIAPAALVPFDYGREAYTRLLWVMEGLTSYYDGLILARAGLIGIGDYLGQLAESAARLANRPGKDQQSLEQASFDAWIKYYRPDSNDQNSTVTYYHRGQLAGFLLDLEIRRRSRGRRSLDDVMRHLAAHHDREHGGIPEDAMPAIIEAATGLKLGRLIERLSRGTGDLPYGPAVRALGLEMKVSPAGGDQGWAGLNLKPGGTVVDSVRSGSPAETAGLQDGDEIIALAGYRVRRDSLLKRLGDLPLGRPANVDFFREERLLRVELAPVRSPLVKFELRRRPRAGAGARCLFEDWCRRRWDEA